MLKINGLENYDEYDIRIIIANYIDNLLIGVAEKEFKYKSMELIGSRISGKNRKNSDLDVIVYYSGSMKEDGAFNLLNDNSYRLYIDGILVDINPKRTYSA